MKQWHPHKLIMLHLRQAHAVGYMYTHCHLRRVCLGDFSGKLC